VLESALEAIDSTTIAFQLSRNVASHTERIEKARQARDGLVMALKELEEGIDEDDDVRTTPTWQHWHADAQRGLADRCQSDSPITDEVPPQSPD